LIFGYHRSLMSIAKAHGDILKQIASWPVEEKVSLAHEILYSVQGAPASGGSRRNTLARALGLARVEGSVPDDAEVRRMLDEHRMEKYGR